MTSGISMGHVASCQRSCQHSEGQRCSVMPLCPPSRVPALAAAISKARPGSMLPLGLVFPLMVLWGAAAPECGGRPWPPSGPASAPQQSVWQSRASLFGIRETENNLILLVDIFHVLILYLGIQSQGLGWGPHLVVLIDTMRCDKKIWCSMERQGSLI